MPKWKDNHRSTVICDRDYCPAPPETLKSGATLFDPPNVYRFGDIVRYRCPTGQIVADSTRVNVIETRCIIELITGLPPEDRSSYSIYWYPDVFNFTCVPVKCLHPGRLFILC